ncbi:MAG: hypothetical protein AB1599_01685 [Planctomycetota bacterium]
MPIETKKTFDPNPKRLRQPPRQARIIICWDIKSRGALRRDSKLPYKYTANMDGVSIEVYVMKEMGELIEIKPPRYSDLPDLIL